MSTFAGIIKSSKPTLVDFFVEWFGPCRTMNPILGDLKRKVGSSATIFKIDIDKNRQVANT